SPAETTAAASIPPLFAPTATPAPSPAPTAVSDARPLASSGSIALEGSDSSISVVDTRGSVTRLVDASLGIYGFPAWSPDGTRIAALRASLAGDISIVIIDPSQAGTPITPRVIFHAPTVNPFYLFWHPDGTAVSFLADESGDISLRQAAADGSMPLDG